MTNRTSEIDLIKRLFELLGRLKELINDHAFVYTASEVIILLKDRGTKKWASLMLPEHVELLKMLWTEDEKLSKPILDEQELEIIYQRLIQAYKQQHSVKLTIYMDGMMEEIYGKIIKFNEENICFRLDDDTEVLINLHRIMSMGIR